FDTIFKLSDPNDMVNSFYNAFLTALDKNAPLTNKTKRFLKFPAWSTQELRQLIKRRNNLLSQFKQNNSLDTFHKYKDTQKHVKKLSNFLKKDHYHDQIFSNKNNPTKL